jgi:hypothetical protein
MDRRRTILSVAVVLLAGSYVVATGIGPTTMDEPGDSVSTVRDSQLIQPVDNESYLWPYTSRSESPSGRTLAVNVIIYGPPDRTRTALADAGKLDWEPVNASETDADAESYTVDDGLNWDDAAGSTRYSYVDRRLEDGHRQWVDESYQLHTGSYLGSRYHVRAYSSPSGEWTAVQVHEEYFDWFRLRHTVTDIHDSSRLIEREFIDQPFVDGVSRTYYGTTRGWNDGWITEIELTFALLLSTILAPKKWQELRQTGRDLGRAAIRNRHGFLLAGALAGLLLGVRAAGIALETAIPGQSPQLVCRAVVSACRPRAADARCPAGTAAQPAGSVWLYSRRTGCWLRLRFRRHRCRHGTAPARLTPTRLGGHAGPARGRGRQLPQFGAVR